MTEDLKINSTSKLNKRLLISDGSMTTDLIESMKCLPLTYIPKEPWRGLTKKELIAEHQLKLLIFDAIQEEIVLWKE